MTLHQLAQTSLANHQEFAPLIQQLRRTNAQQPVGQIPPCHCAFARGLPRAAQQTGLQIIEPLQRFIQPAARMQSRQTSGERVEIFPRAFGALPDALPQQPWRFRHKLAAGKDTLGDDFRRRAGRGRAHVRHEIADGEINLVPDGRDDRNRRFKNRPRHGFFVERPQILQRTAAARDQNQIQSHCSSRRQSALTFRWSGLTSAATRTKFIE